MRGTLGELAARYADDAAARRVHARRRGRRRPRSPAIDVEAELRALLAAGLGPKDAAARLVVVDRQAAARSSTSSRCRSADARSERSTPRRRSPTRLAAPRGRAPHAAVRARRRSSTAIDSAPQVVRQRLVPRRQLRRARRAHRASRTCSSTCSRTRSTCRRITTRSCARAGASEANASTSADRTAYHEVVPAHELALALWLESDRMGYFAARPRRPTRLAHAAGGRARRAPPALRERAVRRGAVRDRGSRCTPRAIRIAT